MASDTTLDGVVSPEQEGPAIAGEGGDGLLLGPESDWQPVLSFVLPTLNEEAGVAGCIEQIKAVIADLELPAEIIVSDSSTDRTPQIARDHGAIVVEPVARGYGAAYQRGFDEARGDYIVMGDADTTYDFAEVPALLERLAAADADLVLGSRLRGEIKPGAMPATHRYVGNPLLTKFLNLFYDAGVTDAHSGLRVFTRDALESMAPRSRGMEFASEMVMEAAVQGLTIEEVPITYHEREGDAKLHTIRDGWRHVKFMLVNAPGYLFSVPGIVFALLGSLLMGAAFFEIGWDGIHPGINSLIAGSLLVISGYQIISLGVFATVSGTPIRNPTDPVTTWIVDHINLERGASIGLAVFAGGAGYAGYLVLEWISSGFTVLPVVTAGIVGFTLITIGIQIIFSAFFLSTIKDDR